MGFTVCGGVLQECELGKGEKGVKKRQNGFLFGREVNGRIKWFESGDEETGHKYVGEINNGKPNGQGTWHYSEGAKFVGEWKYGKPWNVTGYNKNGKILGKFVNGKAQ